MYSFSAFKSQINSAANEEHTMFELLINTWLDFPLWLTIPTTLLVWMTSAAGLWWLFQYSRWTSFWRTCLGVVPPYLGLFGALFGISIGFMGADIWQRIERAQQAVLQEASALDLLTRYASALGSAGEPVTASVCVYANAVIQQEWPTMVLEGMASPDTETALNNLTLLLVAPEFTTQVNATVGREMLSITNQIRQYRVSRIHLSSSHSNTGKWMLLLFLGFMSQISISMVHLDKSRAQALALTVFTITIVVSLNLLAGMDQPFTSPFAVSNTPIAELTGCPMTYQAGKG